MDFLANELEREYGAVLQMPGSANHVDKLESENAHLKTQLKKLREYVGELELAVDMDPLVPVYNRRAFIKELSRAQSVLDRYDIPSCVIYLDLDGFKAVNDKHGHCAGDELLKRVGEVIQSGIRECDMVARLGGDEFAILLFKTHPETAKAKAAILASRIAEIEIGTLKGIVSTTAAWGVSTCTMTHTPNDILSLADQEMYVAKRTAHDA